MDLIGVSVAAWYSNWPRPRRKLYSAPPTLPSVVGGSSSGGGGGGMAGGGVMLGVGGKRRTIDHYYVSQHCPQCDTITNSGYCEACLANYPALYLSVVNRLNEVESRSQHLLNVCHSCIGSGYKGVHPQYSPSALYPLDVECSSHACPVFFKRYQLQELVRDVQHRLKLFEDA